jgi:hypothetical protein
MKAKQTVKLVSLETALKHYLKHGSIKLTGKSVEPFRTALKKLK